MSGLETREYSDVIDEADFRQEFVDFRDEVEAGLDESDGLTPEQKRRVKELDTKAAREPCETQEEYDFKKMVYDKAIEVQAFEDAINRNIYSTVIDFLSSQPSMSSTLLGFEKSTTTQDELISTVFSKISKINEIDIGYYSILINLVETKHSSTNASNATNIAYAQSLKSMYENGILLIEILIPPKPIPPETKPNPKLSLVDYLQSEGLDFDTSTRIELAELAGIQEKPRSKERNTAILKEIVAGRLDPINLVYIPEVDTRVSSEDTIYTETKVESISPQKYIYTLKGKTHTQIISAGVVRKENGGLYIQKNNLKPESVDKAINKIKHGEYIYIVEGLGYIPYMDNALESEVQGFADRFLEESGYIIESNKKISLTAIVNGKWNTPPYILENGSPYISAKGIAYTSGYTSSNEMGDTRAEALKSELIAAGVPEELIVIHIQEQDYDASKGHRFEMKVVD